ncbi:MAG: hypothetical protein AAGA55_01095 [Planctomycetota bacterium]
MTGNLMPTENEGGLPANLTGESDDLGMPGIPAAPAAAPQSKSKVSGQVVLAGVVLLLAGGAIYGMRFMGLNAAFGGDDIKVDYTAEKGEETARRFERVMAELDASMSAVQVAEGGSLGSASFNRPVEEEPDAGAYQEPADLNDLDRLARLAEERRLQAARDRMELIQGELSRLNVQGIIGGRVPAARINGQPVRVGQQLGVFEVVEISGKGVIVRADGIDYELRIGLPPRAAE